MPRKSLTEDGTLGKVTEAKSDGSYKIQVISPGLGSSGWYSAEVLEAAAKAKVWGKDTKVFFDHPTATEDEERPARSVKDLAAVLTEDATWDGSALVARIKPVGGLGKTMLENDTFRQAVGVSVRASAEGEVGEVAGKQTWIVSEIFPGTFNSVDLVTYPGRGGLILESARAEQDKESSAEPRTLSETSASDAERAIRDAVNQAYSDSKAQTYAWVRDYDPDQKFVYFELDVAGVCTTYQQTYEVRATGDVELAGDKTEVAQRTVYVPVAANESALPPLRFTAPSTTTTAYLLPGATTSTTTVVPVHPAGQSTTIKEHTMPEIEEGAKVSIAETRLRTLEADAGRVPALEAKVVSESARADLAEQDLAVEKAREYARDFGTKRVKEANGDLPHAVVDKIVAEAMREIPLTEADKAVDRRLDTDAFGKKVDESQKTEETYLASIVENGAGMVRGVGSTSNKAEVTEAQLDKLSAGTFSRPVRIVKEA